MTDADSLAASLRERIGEETGEAAFLRAVALTVEHVAEALHVSADEVAIFIPTQAEAGAFRFAAPLPLYQDGSRFPSRGSLTMKVFETGDPFVDNNVKVKKPLSIYERAKISERRPRPIQKMAAVRMDAEGASLGVLQASRRGIAVREAGPDFSNHDLDALRVIGQAAAPFLRRTIPDAF